MGIRRFMLFHAAASQDRVAVAGEALLTPLAVKGNNTVVYTEPRAERHRVAS